MELGSHNAWSYLPPKKWWMKLIGFTAKCQHVSIREQYKKYNVKCFDLHVNTSGGYVHVVHGKVEYDISYKELKQELRWLDYRKDVSVRVILDIRNKKEFTEKAQDEFIKMCKLFEKSYKNIKFWCGRNLYNWEVTYQFAYEPSCEEKYSSVCKPKIVDDWWPWLFAKKNNKELVQEGTDKDILLIDFVDYQ